MSLLAIFLGTMGEGILLTAVVMLVAAFFIEKPFGKVSFSVTCGVVYLLQVLLVTMTSNMPPPTISPISILGILAIVLDVGIFHGLFALGHWIKRRLKNAKTI